MAGSVQNTLTDLGGAVSDLFGSRAARISAGSYSEAQRIAEENALLTRQATRIKAEQISRQVGLSLGTTKAGVAGAGFAESGSALDILRSSASQGAITKAINEEQGTITANAYEEQANQFGAMAAAAKSSSTGQGIAGLLQLGGAGFNAAGLLSGGSSVAVGGSEAALPAGAADLAELAVVA